MKPFLNKFLNILHFRRHAAFLATLGAVFLGFVFLFAPHNAFAFEIVNDVVVPAIGFVASIFFSLLGKLLSAIISALIWIAKYNRIIDQPTVQSTWGIMRDFVNMFFVFALLLIAFSTILRIRQYEVKQLLPRLIIYAVLVNFSLNICGLFIDIAQIVMLTFVNAFEGSALNNLTSMTGLLDYGSLQLDSGTANSGEVLAGYVLAIAFMVIAIIVIGAMMVMLLIRIMMLWILAILSPFAFVLPVIPKAEKYAGQWWSMFSNYVISGPLLAFFIWLALTVVGQNTSIGQEIIQDGGVMIVKTKVGNSGFFINFIIAIGMLFAGLMLTAQLGGAMGKIAGGATNVIYGKTGPTPMRWARERYEAYRGMRSSIRKEGAQRFAASVSATQDKIYSTPLSLSRSIINRGKNKIQEGREDYSEIVKDYKAGKISKIVMRDRINQVKEDKIKKGMASENFGRKLESRMETLPLVGGAFRRAGERVRNYNKAESDRLEKEYNVSAWDAKKRKMALSSDNYERALKNMVALRHVQAGEGIYNNDGTDYDDNVKQWIKDSQKSLFNRAPEVLKQFNDQLVKVAPELAFLTDSLKTDVNSMLISIKRGDVKGENLMAKTFETEDGRVTREMFSGKSKGQAKDMMKKFDTTQQKSIKKGLESAADKVFNNAAKKGSTSFLDTEREVFSQFAALTGKFDHISSKLSGLGLHGLRDNEFAKYFSEASAKDIEKVDKNSINNDIVMTSLMKNSNSKVIENLSNSDMGPEELKEMKKKIIHKATTIPRSSPFYAKYQEYDDAVKNSRGWKYVSTV